MAGAECLAIGRAGQFGIERVVGIKFFVFVATEIAGVDIGMVFATSYYFLIVAEPADGGYGVAAVEVLVLNGEDVVPALEG